VALVARLVLVVVAAMVRLEPMVVMAVTVATVISWLLVVPVDLAE
jgi:hypothetical protein